MATLLLYKYLISYNFKKQLELLVLYLLTYYFQGERGHQLLLNAIAFAAPSDLLSSVLYDVH